MCFESEDRSELPKHFWASNYMKLWSSISRNCGIAINYTGHCEHNLLRSGGHCRHHCILVETAETTGDCSDLFEVVLTSRNIEHHSDELVETGGNCRHHGGWCRLQTPLENAGVDYRHPWKLQRPVETWNCRLASFPGHSQILSLDTTGGW